MASASAQSANSVASGGPRSAASLNAEMASGKRPSAAYARARSRHPVGSSGCSFMRAASLSTIATTCSCVIAGRTLASVALVSAPGLPKVAYSTSAMAGIAATRISAATYDVRGDAFAAARGGAASSAPSRAAISSSCASRSARVIAPAASSSSSWRFWSRYTSVAAPSSTTDAFGRVRSSGHTSAATVPAASSSATSQKRGAGGIKGGACEADRGCGRRARATGLAGPAHYSHAWIRGRSATPVHQAASGMMTAPRCDQTRPLLRDPRRKATMSDQDKNIRDDSLAYHRRWPPGKISLLPTKQLTNQRDLALAYTPGVAAACDEIVRDPHEAFSLTARGNLVGVVTNGTAVLGLGNIGPLAGKPVMEGKAVLFKKFAGLDCFDIELAERDPDKLVDMICALEPTFGGVNLEDIKAPECFYIERKCRERMKIPVFHDDQHGTAIIVGAAVLNGLRVVDKKFEDVKLVCSGAGAAALACLDLLVTLGVRRDNIFVADIKGVVYEGRTEEMDDNKARYAQPTTARSLREILPGADVFLGLSAGRVLKPEWLATMAPKPLILALANPEPEIMPDVAKSARPDAIIATGRSDFPNQVNNVLCFPFIFRGALDVGATAINEAMKLACVRAIADLALAEQSDIVATAYGTEDLAFGPDYLIPKPFDPRLIVQIAPAVAKAAMESGVATRPIADFDAYRARLTSFVYHSGLLMKPIFTAAKQSPKRIVYAEGEDERVLRAAKVVVDEQ